MFVGADVRIVVGLTVFFLGVGCGRIGFDAGPLTTGERDGGSRMDGGATFDAEVRSDGAAFDGAGSLDGASYDGSSYDGALPDGGLPDGAVLEPYPDCPPECTGGCYGYRSYSYGWYYRSCTVNDPVGIVLCPSGFTCFGRCATLGSCTQEIVCDRSCTITCSGEAACSGGLRCAAGSCSFQCTGIQSCSGPIVGVDQRVAVTCSGSGSCGGPIDCSAACACLVDCDSAANCSNLTCRTGCDGPAGCRESGRCGTC
jgi:hypothetical protein